MRVRRVERERSARGGCHARAEGAGERVGAAGKRRAGAGRGRSRALQLREARGRVRGGRGRGWSGRGEPDDGGPGKCWRAQVSLAPRAGGALGGSL